jgi:hypothetical protein
MYLFLFISYGDITPKTTFGKIVGSFVILTGILVIALPVFIVTENFTKVSIQNQRTERIRQLNVNFIHEFK